MLRKVPSNKINRTKNAFFFFPQALSHYSFIFNLRLLYELKHKVRLSKTAYGIFHFWFRFSFIKVYILLLDLGFKLQKNVLKLNDICMSWSSPKTDLETYFLNLENRSIENASFSQ